MNRPSLATTSFSMLLALTAAGVGITGPLARLAPAPRGRRHGPSRNRRAGGVHAMYLRLQGRSPHASRKAWRP